MTKKTQESTEGKNVKSKKINESKSIKKVDKKIYFLIIAIVIIISIVGIFWFLQGSDIVKAQLIIDSGDVFVKHDGESWIEAQNGMILYESDSIKTDNNSFATIVLFESSVIRLDSNTEIMIKEIIDFEGENNILIQQDSGRTWNTVLKISGIDNYEVQTPTTVATVRGTSFDIHILENGTTDSGVSRGVVIISSYKNGKVIDSIEVLINESVWIDPELINKSLKKKPFEKDDWVIGNEKKDVDIITLGISSFINSDINVKQMLYERIEPYIPELKSRYGMTDEELDVLIDGYLLGLYDLPPETPEWIMEIIEIS